MSIKIKETLRIKPTRQSNHSPIILSNLDFIMPKLYTSIIFFFKNVNNERKFMDIHKLCASLADILSDYYPLAGQFKMEPEGGMSIICNDQGVPFVVAESPDIIFQQFEEKNWSSASVPDGTLAIAKYIPDTIDTPLFAVKHTTLADGSVILGMSLHHSVADGHAFFDFIENWGLKTNQKQFTPPIHDRSLLKASGNLPTQEHPEYILIDSTATMIPPKIPKIPPTSKKIFYFSKDNLKKLKDNYSSKNSNDPRISTNDALVAHIWRTATRARGIPLDTQVSCVLAIDGRKILNPPIPSNYFGNVVPGALPKMFVSELINGPKSDIAIHVRKSIAKVDDSKIKSIIDWVEQLQNKHVIRTATRSFCDKDFIVTSWAKFQMYNLDFGYGTPIKCRLQSNKSTPFDGVSVIFGTPADDDGLEVYIGLVSEHMQKLEQDPEFKMYQ